MRRVKEVSVIKRSSWVLNSNLTLLRSFLFSPSFNAPLFHDSPQGSTTLSHNIFTSHEMTTWWLARTRKVIRGTGADKETREWGGLSSTNRASHFKCLLPLALTFHFQKLCSVVDLPLMFSFSHTFYQTDLHPQQMGVLKERSQKALGAEWKSQYDGTQGVIAAWTPST